MMNNNGDNNVLLPLPGNRQFRNIPRLFKSPPQPHMCVQDSIKGSDIPCFINVLSWSRIGLPSEPSAPIPLYGGVLVPLSDRCSYPTHAKSNQEKPLAFAVVVNPFILEQCGKKAVNPREREGLIDMILDFVEAMNHGIKFSRKFDVLKDRDLTGELKDIWTLIQVKRDAEKNYCNQLSRDENSYPYSAPTQTACTGVSINSRHKRGEEEDDFSDPNPTSAVCHSVDPLPTTEPSPDS